MSYKPPWEFHQIYNFSAVWHNDELIRFEIKMSKVKMTARPNTYSQISISGYFLTNLWNARSYFNEAYHNYSLPNLHDINNIFKTMSLKIKDNKFSEKKIFRRKHADRWFAVEDHI